MKKLKVLLHLHTEFDLKSLKTHHFRKKTSQFDFFGLKNTILQNFTLTTLEISSLALKILKHNLREMHFLTA